MGVFPNEEEKDAGRATKRDRDEPESEHTDKTDTAVFGHPTLLSHM